MICSSIKNNRMLFIHSIKGLRCSSSLAGRSLVVPKDFSSDDIKSVLWTAIDLKSASKRSPLSSTSFNISVLVHEPCFDIQIPIKLAGSFLNYNVNVLIHPTWENTLFINDVGRLLSTYSDMIFCQSKYQSKIKIIRESARVPVVSIRCCTFSIVSVLSNLMTIQEKYGHLSKVSIGFIGKVCPVLNTYLCIAPRLGIDLKYFCTCGITDQRMSPSMLPVGKNMSKKFHTKLKECNYAITAMDRVEVIALSQHNANNFKLKMKDILERAKKDWSLLHELPRSVDEVDEDVFNHENSLVWTSKANLKWIYAALMLRLLKDYEHSIKMPNF